MANLSEAFPNTNSFENPKVKNYFNSQDNLFMRPQQPVNNVVNEIDNNYVRQLFANPLFRQWLTQSILSVNNSGSTGGASLVNACQEFFVKHTGSCILCVAGIILLLIILLIMKK